MVCQSQDSTTGGRDIKKRQRNNMQQTATNSKACRAQNPPSFSPPNAWTLKSLNIFIIFPIRCCHETPYSLEIELGDFHGWRGEREVVMETEWKAKTGRVSLLTRSAATVRLAYSVSRSVKKLESWLHSWDSQVQKHVKIVMSVPGFCVSSGISKYQTIIYLNVWGVEFDMMRSAWYVM